MLAAQPISRNPQLRTPERSTAAIGREGKCSRTLPGDGPASATLQFQPLDINIVSEAIPAFFIGRNTHGFWVARDAKGKIGGIFLLKGSALAFARRHNRPAGCAMIFPSEAFELDLENNGNPLVAYLGPLVRLTIRGRRRMAGLICIITEAIKRRLEDFRKR